eukprot:4271225-Prymnesium_polylepis.1
MVFGFCVCGHVTCEINKIYAIGVACAAGGWRVAQSGVRAPRPSPEPGCELAAGAARRGWGVCRVQLRHASAVAARRSPAARPGSSHVSRETRPRRASSKSRDPLWTMRACAITMSILLLP